MPIVGIPSATSINDDKRRDEFIDKMRTQVSHVFDDPVAIWNEQGVTSQPGWVFVSADGTAERVPGSMPSRELLARLEDMAAAA